MKNYIKILIGIAFISIIATSALSANAYNYNDSFVENLQVECTKEKGGNCSLNDIIKIGLVAVDFILGIVGALALLYFILGGAAFLISGLNDKWRSWGRDAIKNAIIGLVIIFTSWLVVRFVITGIGVDGGRVTPGLNITVEN